MSLRKVAFVGCGLAASACGLEVFDLEPLAGDSASLPTEVREPPASTQAPIELHGGVSEALAPGAAGGTPAAAVSAAAPPWPVADGAGAAAAPDGGAAAPGCNAIDFLFVIDNSLSMLQEQSNLAASFAGFMQVVSGTLPATDHHIMVIDTDGWDGDGAQSDPEQCEDTLGAGKRASALGADCGVEGPQRFIVPGQPDLSGVFSCLARVGTFGDFGEQPVDALLRALSAENGPGGCNAGFSRPDAILVVVLVTDEDDTRSAGQAEDWRRALIEAKGGNERAVVVLGLLGDDNVEGGLPGGPCPPVSFDAPELQRFVQSLPLGSLASVCAENYAPFLEQAVTNIQSACEELRVPLR